MLILSLDIETFGACEHALNGDALPIQTTYHPQRSLDVDEVPLKHLVQTVAITKTIHPSGVIEPHFPCTVQPWVTTRKLHCPPGLTKYAMPFAYFNGEDLADVDAGDTMVFLMGDDDHHQTLLEWLDKADIIIGHNIAFDILYLRAFSAAYAIALTPAKVSLIDTSVIAYLENEHRPERTLKALSNLLGTHTYERTLTLKGTVQSIDRFLNPTEVTNGHSLQTYNAQDSHTTLLNLKEHARRIAAEHTSTSKLDASCLTYFSHCLWCAIHKTEAGLPLDRTGLAELEEQLVVTIDEAREACTYDYDLLLSGTGSKKSQDEFIERLLTAHPRLREANLELSAKQRRVSWTNYNRQLFGELIPADDDFQAPLALATTHSSSSKLLTTYVRNLLYDQHKGIGPRGLAYPNWYIIPSTIKDDTEEGGQLQARPSIKNPPAQTFPPAIRQFYKSRYPNGTILSFDLSQAELRTAALLSGDGFLLAAYCDGLDLHTERAKSIYGATIEQSKDFPRYRAAAKHFNFGDLYRAGAAKLKLTLKRKAGIEVPLAVCEEVVATRRIQRPGLMDWQDTLIRFAKRHGHIEIPFTGHSRFFLAVTKYLDNEIVNFPIQAIAAITLWFIEQHVVLNFLPYFPHTHLFLNHYDALIFDTDNPVPLRAAILEAVHYTETQGYWAWISHLTGHTVPLIGDFATYGAPLCQSNEAPSPETSTISSPTGLATSHAPTASTSSSN